MELPRSVKEVGELYRNNFIYYINTKYSAIAFLVCICSFALLLPIVATCSIVYYLQEYEDLGDKNKGAT